MNYDAVSFPNLGIGQIRLDPTAIRITENISIQWYAAIICIGMIVAYFVCNSFRKRLGISEDDFLDCVLYTIPIAFIGARLTYVVGDIENFHSFMEVIAVWKGGLAIYGGVIFAAVSVFVVCRIKKCDFRKMFDIMAIGFLIGQIIGRWGNFVNIEVYGVETNLPWAMGIGYYGTGAEELVHPLFLYESLWNFVGFVLIYGYKDYRKFNGEIFLWYCAWYGLGRGFMEPLRNSEYNLHLFGIRIMLVLAFAICIASVTAIIIFRRRSKGYVADAYVEKEKHEQEYDKQFNIDIDSIEPSEQLKDEQPAKEEEEITDDN